MPQANINVTSNLIGFDQVLQQLDVKINSSAALTNMKNEVELVMAEIKQAEELEKALDLQVKATAKLIKQNQKAAGVSATEIRFLWIQFQQVAQQIASYYKDVAWIQEAFTVIQIGNLIDMARRFALETKEAAIKAAGFWVTGNIAGALVMGAAAAALGTLTVTTTALQASTIMNQTEQRRSSAESERRLSYYIGMGYTQ